MRILITDCSAVYQGRLAAQLPRATRVLMFKADGSVLIHSDGGSYKPLNWMSPPCWVSESTVDGVTEFEVMNKTGETLTIMILPTIPYPYLPLLTRPHQCEGAFY